MRESAAPWAGAGIAGVAGVAGIAGMLSLSMTVAWGQAQAQAETLTPAQTPAQAAARAASSAVVPLPTPTPTPTPTPAPAASTPPRYPGLPAPATPRDADALQLQFAQRLVAAHPDTSYTSRAPDRLLAIPVLEVELHADGSVRRIAVLRRPTTGREGDEATALAIAAVRRAAPYGNVSRLPKPWKVVEVFLFNDSLQFKPHTLDAD